MASPGRGLKQVRLWAAAIIFLHASIMLAQTAIWKPAQNTSWQWQLTTPMDQTVDVAVYDIDLFESDASVVAALHAKGRRVICYMSAGSWESFRADAGKVPDSV